MAEGGKNVIYRLGGWWGWRRFNVASAVHALRGLKLAYSGQDLCSVEGVNAHISMYSSGLIKNRSRRASQHILLR